MPLASMHFPITPPRASISRTICPFATPPIAGLQLICATASAFMLSRHVFRPRRAAAIAASVPACPAPTTTTSNRYSKVFTAFSQRNAPGTLSMIASRTDVCAAGEGRPIVRPCGKNTRRISPLVLLNPLASVMMSLLSGSRNPLSHPDTSQSVRTRMSDSQLEQPTGSPEPPSPELATRGWVAQPDASFPTLAFTDLSTPGPHAPGRATHAETTDEVAPPPRADRACRRSPGTRSNSTSVAAGWASSTARRTPRPGASSR